MIVGVTGFNGFVGKNLVAYLKRSLGANTLLLDREVLNNSLSVSLSKVDCLIHLAGKAHDLIRVSDPNAYYEVNFELTKKIYDAFLVSGASKFIFISSVKAAADSVDQVLTEEVIPSPKTHYGKSKLLAEQYIQQQPLPEGKSYYILRPCMIHGPGNKGNLNLLYQFVRKGLPYPLTAFKNKRSFLSIENLCFVIKELIRQQVPSDIYHVADDEALSTTDVISILAESLNKKPVFLNIPATLMVSLARIGTYFKLPYNTDTLQKLTENYVVDNSKIQKALKKSLPLTTGEGLLRTAMSFKL